MPEGPDLVLRFGTQLDTQTVNGGLAGELTPEHAARYIAKYSVMLLLHTGCHDCVEAASGWGAYPAGDRS
jgi:hypothetical protein